MFLTPAELSTHLHDYQVEQISAGDTSIALSAISTAQAQVRSYLATRYDCDAIFAATGTNRDALVLHLVKSLAAYHLVRLANPDAIYERYRDDYRDAIDTLTRLSDGTSVADLPRIQTSSGQPAGTLQLQSTPKFGHSY